MFKVKGDDFYTQEVVHVVTARLDGEVKVEEIVKRHGDRRHEVDEHTSQFALRRRVKSQIHRYALTPVKIMTLHNNATFCIQIGVGRDLGRRHFAPPPRNVRRWRFFGQALMISLMLRMSHCTALQTREVKFNAIKPKITCGRCGQTLALVGNGISRKNRHLGALDGDVGQWKQPVNHHNCSTSQYISITNVVRLHLLRVRNKECTIKHQVADSISICTQS